MNEQNINTVDDVSHFEIKEFDITSVSNSGFFASETTIIKCTKGNATILIDSKEMYVSANTTVILVELKHYKLKEYSNDIKLLACSFSEQFINELYGLIDNKILDTIHGISTFDTQAESLQAEMYGLNLMFDKLCWLYQNKNHIYRYRTAINVAICYVLDYYNMVHQFANELGEDSSNYTNYILDNFFMLCSKHHLQHRSIDFYADNLNISSRYLHTIIKRSTNLTPKQMIDFYVLGSIKRMLLTTTLNNKQIADKLNFPDQSSFGQYFKRNVGMSASEFRKLHR